MAKLNYKARLAMLGKRQAELIPELRERLELYTISAEDVSRALNNIATYPKHEAIRSAADVILSEWERMAKKNGS